METKQSDKRLIAGVIIVLIGAVILASNFGVLPSNIRYYLFHWEVILMGIGVIALLTSEHKGTGIILIAVGGAFYLRNFIDLHFNFWQLFIPSMIILLGLILIFRRRTGNEYGAKVLEPGEDYMDDVSIFGGSEKVVSSKNFKGGKITAIFGGSAFNMSGVKLAPGPQYIDIFALFGGATFIVPEDWNIRIKVVSIFGGFSDKHRVTKSEKENNNKDNMLIIKGLAIFGGGEVKSY
jgi:predicted membrane protein